MSLIGKAIGGLAKGAASAGGGVWGSLTNVLTKGASSAASDHARAVAAAAKQSPSHGGVASALLNAVKK